MTEVNPATTHGFLFADLRGYTHFVETRGDEAAAALLTRYRALVRDVIGGFGGAEIRTEGDSFYVVFPSASSAVLGGLAILAAASAAAGSDPAQSFNVGIGVHAGETAEHGEGPIGSAVNIAARVCAQARPGELLVTDTVRSLTRTRLTVRFTPRGSPRLKGIREPIPLFAVQPSTEFIEPGAEIPAGRAARISARIRARPAARWGIPVAAVLVVTALVGASFLLGAPNRPPSGGAGGPRNSSAPLSAALGWATSRGDAARRGVGDQGPVGQPVLRWRFQAAGAIDQSPAAVGGVVYVISDDAILHALSDTDGKQLWAFPDAHGAQGPAVWNGAVYVADSAGAIHAIDVSTGKERWHSATALQGEPVAGAGSLYVSTTGAIVALDPTTGSERWRYAVPKAGEFHPPAFADGMVYAGSDSGGFVALDASTGALRWHADTGTDTTGTAVVADGIAYVGSSVDSATGHLYAFNATNGKLVWRLDQAIFSPAVSGGIAYSVNLAGTVSAHQTETGQELWHFQTKGPGRPVGVAGGVVYVPADSEHRIYALDAQTGAELWHFDLDGGVTGSLAVTHGSVYIGTSAGSLYAIGSIVSPVKFLWQAKGDGDGLDFPNALAIAPDGRIWVADTGHDRFAIFKPDGTFVEYWGSAGRGNGQFVLRRSNGDGYGALAFAPDGSFYVLDVGNRRVQHFDKARHFVGAWGGFGSQPGKFVDPVAIAVDRKGLIHVLDDQRGVVETYDRDGRVLSSFNPHLSGFNSANAMTIDAKGSVYVSACCSAGDQVRKYATTGKLVLKIGSPGTGPGQFSGQPGGLSVDSAGRVFVSLQVPTEGDGILVFDASGRFLTSFGKKGSADGQLGFATSVLLDGEGALYASDAAPSRIEKFKLLPPLGTM